MQNSRRIILKAAALAAVPLTFYSAASLAAKNDATRTALKYQPTPNAGKQCSGCVQFVPGKTPKDNGGCKAIPNDTEIAPTGYCIAWVELKK